MRIVCVVSCVYTSAMLGVSKRDFVYMRVALCLGKFCLLIFLLLGDNAVVCVISGGL